MITDLILTKQQLNSLNILYSRGGALPESIWRALGGVGLDALQKLGLVHSFKFSGWWATQVPDGYISLTAVGNSLLPASDLSLFTEHSSLIHHLIKHTIRFSFEQQGWTWIDKVDELNVLLRANNITMPIKNHWPLYAVTHKQQTLFLWLLFWGLSKTEIPEWSRDTSALRQKNLLALIAIPEEAAQQLSAQLAQQLIRCPVWSLEKKNWPAPLA